MRNPSCIAMPVYGLIKDRRSIRKYKQKGPMIDKKDMEKILDAGRMAPSAKNRQKKKCTRFREKPGDKFCDSFEQQKNIRGRSYATDEKN